MTGFFKNIKRSFGKNNPAYQKSLKYYDLYHHLPCTTQLSGKLFNVGTILILLFILGANALFFYAFIQGLLDTSENKTSDYRIGMTMVPCFAAMFIAVGFFIIRFKIRQRKKWKTFANAIVNGEGIIIGKWWESTAQVDNIGGMDYFIAIEYKGARKVKAPVSSGDYYKLRINDKVKLRFVSFQPELCELLL